MNENLKNLVARLKVDAPEYAEKSTDGRRCAWRFAAEHSGLVEFRENGTPTQRAERGIYSKLAAHYGVRVEQIVGVLSWGMDQAQKPSFLAVAAKLEAMEQAGEL